MAGADRAINMPLRVQGISGVESDFKKVGASGSKAFSDIEKAADKASRAGNNAGAGAKIGLPVPAKVPGNLSGGIPQTTQAIDVFTGSTARAGDAAASMASRVALATAAGIAFGAAVSGTAKLIYESLQAFEEHEAAVAKFESTLRLTGNSSLATSAQIEQMAQRVEDSTDQTKIAALEAGAALAAVPGLAAEVLEEALDVSARLADSLGSDVQQEAERVGEILSAIADNDVQALFKATEGLNAIFRENVIALLDVGKQAEATRLSLDFLGSAAVENEKATSQLNDAWQNFKLSIGEQFHGVAVASLNAISTALDSNAISLDNFFRLLSGRVPQFKIGTNKSLEGNNPLSSAVSGGLSAFQSVISQTQAASQSRLDRRFGKTPKIRKAGSGRKDNSAERAAKAAAREAEQQKKAADRARDAADKIVESNEDAIASYRLRAEEAVARLGKEGPALEAVLRQQAIDAAARTISRDLIEKEVAARRLSEKANFDEAAVRAEATAKVEAQTGAIREQAAAFHDAEQAQAAFNRRMAEAKALADQVATPLENITREVQRITEMLDNGDISADHFNRRMDQLANDLVDHAERAGNAWQGFGNDVGAAFSDIILNGGSARDILQELIRLPLERLLFQNVETPIANFVDGLTGNNRNDNVAAARGQIDTIAAQGSSQALVQVEVAARSAAFALSSIQPAAQQGVIIPFGEAGASASGAAAGMNTLPPITGQVGTALQQFLAQLGGGGGGGAGGFLSTVLSLGAAAFGGGGITAGSTAALSGASNALITANPGIFHEGGEIGNARRTKRLQFAASPSAQFMQRSQLEPDERIGIFQTGERILSRGQNRALTSLLRGGERSAPRGRLSGGGGGGATFVTNINAPMRMDPKRTAHGLARTTQAALARANSKGLAAGPPRRGA